MKKKKIYGDLTVYSEKFVLRRDLGQGTELEPQPL